MIEKVYPPERGGPLKRPWECPEEVPEDIWTGHIMGNSPPEKHLAYLNHVYYWSYINTKKEKEREASKTPCGAPFCTVMVDPSKEGPNLCGTHMRMLKRDGELGCFRYLGESHA